MVQHLLHQLKYKNNAAIGLQLGCMMGLALKSSGRFSADALIPLPLFPERERKRGYNQAKLLCEGISSVLGIPVLDDIVCRPSHTETQTKKGRVERWKNIDGKFLLLEPEKIEGKHIILVDDVITTGATLESCGQELSKAKNSCISIAALAYAMK
jgi:ComF family protein